MPNDPGACAASGTCSAPSASTCPRPGRWPRRRGAPGGRGAVVAVLDSGVAYERRGRYRRAPDLRRSTFVKGYDFVGRDRHPNDVYGHGTHVAGTIAQTTNNGVGAAGHRLPRAGSCPCGCWTAEGSGDSVAISRAIRYAARRRRGRDQPEPRVRPRAVRAREIPDVLAALRYARRKGVTVVAAAGNQADAAVAYPARARARDRGGRHHRATAARPSTRTPARTSTWWPPAAASTPANADNPWDARHCRPDEPGRSIFQQTFTASVTPLRPAGRLRGHLDGEPRTWPAIAALLIATKRLGRQPEPGRGGGAPGGHRHATSARPGSTPLRLGARERARARCAARAMRAGCRARSRSSG